MDMEDIKIIELYHSRDESALSESRAKYNTMLTGIALGILSNREDSDECVNDTYCKAWNTMPPQKPNSLAAFLGRITRNLSINRLNEKRAQKRGGDRLLCELSDCIPSPGGIEEEIESAELTEIINNWLRSLPHDERVIFMRRYWFGDSLKSLAEKCSTTPDKLAGRIYRLRRKLKSALEKEGVSV